MEEQITELQGALDVLKYIRKVKERIRRLTDDMEPRYLDAAGC